MPKLTKLPISTSIEATKKYGSKIGKNGAVVITGKNLVSTPPPPIMLSAAPASPPKVKNGQISPPPPPIEAPPSGKKLKKFPPPVIKHNENISDANKEKTNNSNKEQTSIDRSKGDKLVISAGGMQTKVLAVYDRWGKEVYHSEDYQNNWDGSEGNINEAANKELAAGTYFYIVSYKQNKNTSRKGWILIKGNSSKAMPKDNLDKTSSLKRVSNYQTKDHQKATTTKTTPQNRNNVFFKAWTLYKPKVEENKNDNC
ncbi:gliding motility-associated C-terminal domain-containing protein [Pedobacter sp. SL55]|uniref:T9SS type B sorting domain-containing protein n=1 Tax=Pedobacter sp. SL55 TaxID=2995161 RepID=UPI00226F04F7|nr:gliding motility-associated C-terminal domain-containing protein [Pedobacter sp. SL55]WAC40621.1 gliding motility-associated C-terminal domain-containing protein [Pedobacter sp. SL55]